MYPIVVSDLDGTLLGSNHKVSFFTKKTLSELAERDVKFIMASGRHYMDVDKIREHLGLDIYLITSNGARVHDQNGKVIFRQDLSVDVVEDLINIDVDDDIHVNIYQDDRWLVAKENPDLLAYHQDSGFHYQICDLKEANKTNTSKVFFTGTPAKLLRLAEDLDKKFKNRASIVFSAVDSLEVMDKGVSKGNALSRVVKLTGYSLQDCIAFGDGMNDVEMLSSVGRGLVMDNAPMMLKRALPLLERADSNDHDGVANYLHHFYQLDYKAPWVNFFYRFNPKAGLDIASL